MPVVSSIPSSASSCLPGGVPISRYIRAQVTSTNAGGRMRRQGSSLGLVLVTSFLVGCSERQLTAPPNVSDLAASAQQLAAQTACGHVSGALVFTRFQFTSQTTAIGEGKVEGELSGGFSAQYYDIEQRGNGVIHMRAHHTRSEEHTSELQSQSNIVCRLLLEKKKYSDQTSLPFILATLIHHS